MEVLNPQLDLESFFARLADAPARVLISDYDGTLSPFRVEREQARPYPEIIPLLRELLNRGRTRVIIVSGRAVDDLLPLLGLTPHPEIWGSHGLERLTVDDTYATETLPEKIRKGLAHLERWIHEERLEGDSELKSSGAAFHWRGKSPQEAEALREKIQKILFPSLQEYGFILSEFDGGIEVRIAGITKGNAIARIIRETPPEAAMAYLGDDTTDEDAFAALAGHGLRVLVRSEFRPTKADVRIAPPDELVQFLRSWLEHEG